MARNLGYQNEPVPGPFEPTDFCVKKVVKAVVEELCEAKGYECSDDAKDVAVIVAEQFLVMALSMAGKMAKHAGRQTIRPVDLHAGLSMTSDMNIFNLVRSEIEQDCFDFEEEEREREREQRRQQQQTD